MTSRRVLVLNHFAVPRAAPGGTRHVELFGRLDDWEAVILASNRNLLTRTVAARGEGVRSVWTTPYSPGGASRILNWASYAIAAFAVGLGQPTDLVYASSPHLLAGLSGWGLSRLKGVPLIVEVRDLWPQVLVDMGQLEVRSPLFRLLKWLERFLYRQAAAVVILAEGNRAAVVTDGADPDRVVFLPNSAEPSDFDVQEERAALRARFGMNGLVFLYAGAHGQANGLSLVLDAAAELQHTHPDIRFWLVGDGLVKQRLVDDAARRGLHNIVFWDPVAKQDMPVLLAASDVGLHVLADVPLFRHGVSPNKLFDYMAAGRPVLTNTPGEVADLVAAAGAGLAVEPTGLARGACVLAEMDPGERAAKGAAGRAFMKAYRSRTVICRDLDALLNWVSSS